MPSTLGQLRRFLGMAGFCRIWISNFGLIAELFYEALKGKDQEPLIWTGLGNAKRPSMLLKKNS